MICSGMSCAAHHALVVAISFFLFDLKKNEILFFLFFVNMPISTKEIVIEKTLASTKEKKLSTLEQ